MADAGVERGPEHYADRKQKIRGRDHVEHRAD